MVHGAPNSKLLIALSAALVTSLLVIAFLAGRESGRSSGSDAAATEHVLPSVPNLETEAETPSETSRTKDAADPWRTRNDDYRYADTHWGELDGIDQRPDGTIVLSNTRDGNGSTRDTLKPGPGPEDAPPVEPRSEPEDQRAAVIEYLQRVDAIRSNAGSGDPNTFAMNMIKAGMGGSTSGFDRLIADTDRMTEEFSSMTPPPSCVPYHQGTLQSLEESREVIEDMKVAIKTFDVQALQRIAPRAAKLQDKAEALRALQEAMRASVR
jgi:hypothetical protein